MVLMPVAVQTRFVSGPVAGQPDAVGTLLVRVYPDAILADSHEPLLTAAEVTAGQQYWRRARREGSERNAWASLLTAATPERAAWIVDASTPSNADGDPVFTEMATRPDHWHRAPEARGLPERWVVVAYRGSQKVRQAVSEPVREGLALTPRLSGDTDDDESVDISGDGLAIPPELRWAYDFDEAVAAGMAVRMPIDAIDAEDGFTTILVYGVRAAETATDQAAQLADLLTAHRYSRGLAFVAQGTPTNNTTEEPSAYPVADPAGAVSFPIARGEGLAKPATDGARLAAALGLSPTVVDHVSGAGRDEQTAAAAMLAALWPATVGYYLEQMLTPDLSAETSAAIRRFATDWVRPRGPLAALRVGAVPYGVLPVGAYSAWVARPAENVPAGLPELLSRMASVAANNIFAAPRVGRTSDPDADLIAVLGMDASARSARIRRSFGYDTTWNLLSYVGADLDGLQRAQHSIGQQILADLGQTGRNPRALYLSFLAESHDFGGPLVAPPPLSQTQALDFDYVAWLVAATPAMLRDQNAPPQPVTALLYLMLRQALLAEYDAAARRVLGHAGELLPFESREAELVGILPPPAGAAQLPTVRTAWERFDLNLSDVTENRPLGEYLADPSVPRGSGLQPLDDYRAAVGNLVGLPSAELDRLFTETLDICSHRVDAWVTGLATRRLAALRTPLADTADPATGAYLGCYGWVVDWRPDRPGPTVDVTAPDGSTVAARTDSDGYVQAPSMLHAAAAAVLRSGYVARTSEARRPYAVDLSSARVRSALAILDAVRETQPLGAVLGYSFERGLHEGHPGVELDRYIDAFRNLYPAVANKAADSGAPADQVAARNVVDGLALLHAWQEARIPWAGEPSLAMSLPQRAAVEAELAALDDMVDAVSDLLLAESVFQILKGSPSAAAATLDSLAQGKRPPEPEVVTTPRSGTVLHQRIAILFGGPAPEWAVVPVTPRAAAAPELDAWLGRLLGDPHSVACTVTRAGAAPSRVSLADLGLRPVDLLAIVQEAQATGAQTELDQRVARAADGTGPATVDYDDPGTAPVSFAVACELLAAAARVLGHGRALTPADLQPPAPVTANTTPAPDPLAGRAETAIAVLAGVRRALSDAGADAAAQRAAFDRAAAFGVLQALTATDSTDTGRILDARLAAAGAAATPAAVLAAVFGTSLPIIAPFNPATADPLGAEPGLGDDPDGTVESWLAQVARVQPAVDAWQDLLVYGRALDRVMGRPRIAQLPATGAPWAALPFASEAQRHRSGLVSLAMLGEPPQAGAWCGLMLAEWPEIIPAREEDTGIAVQFDSPGAQAPQAVLIAVAPDARPAWSHSALEQTLLDTLRLAQIRALDLSQLGAFGQVVPMTFLAANSAGHAVSTSFADLLVADSTFEVNP
ncbi:hypothetical protein Rhe02_58300 [Rhizocola hellebori]|uniref:Uncharacterized protein n=1 Tax=Rhizocola hellebori TaxID=1392758 RepID=A0A8J3QDM5_9ACTN|nr:hypothetical protein Rhe02_58300 [Rhizocola hellebori]